jgi:quercetin dioxygenase-like cupin family protein
VLTVDLKRTDLIEEVSQLDPGHSLRYAFPLSSAEGTASTTIVYFELDPGKRVSRHTDSAEEVLLVLEGTAEATVSSERATLGAGGMAVLPARVPHEVRNTGQGVLRAVGFLASSTVVATFDAPIEEGGDQVFVVGAPLPLAGPLPEEAPSDSRKEEP